MQDKLLITSMSIEDKQEDFMIMFLARSKVDLEKEHP
jgi:hypothetical protein